MHFLSLLSQKHRNCVQIKSPHRQEPGIYWVWRNFEVWLCRGCGENKWYPSEFSFIFFHYYLINIVLVCRLKSHIDESPALTGCDMIPAFCEEICIWAWYIVSFQYFYAEVSTLHPLCWHLYLRNSQWVPVQVLRIIPVKLHNRLWYVHR